LPVASLTTSSKDLAKTAIKPTPGAAKVQAEDQSFIANIIFCSGSLALALRYSVVLIPIIVDECNRGGGEATPPAMVLYAVWGAVGFCLPFVAAFSGRNVAARLQRIFDPGITDRPIYQVGRPLLGCALFALTIYLLAKGLKAAQTQFVPNGWSCRM